MTEQAAELAGENQSLVYVIYVSSARGILTESQLADILAVARRMNAIHHITGILAYWDGNFIQYIEGPAPEIEQLMRNLGGDPRHSGIIIMQRGAVARRAFPEWTMAFDRKIDGKNAPGSGASRFLTDGFLTTDPANLSPQAKRLLEVFRQNLR